MTVFALHPSLKIGCAVAAVEIFGIPAMIKEQTGEDSSSYQVTAEVRLFKFEEELAALNSSLEKGDIRTSFESKAELEQYLGLVLMDSSLLESAGIVEDLEKSFEYGFDLYPALKKEANARFVVSLLDESHTECTADPHIITITSHRVIKNMEFYVEASIFTELFDAEKLKDGVLTDNYEPSAYLITTLTRDENGEIKIETEDCYDALYNFTTAEYEMNNGNKALVVTAEKYIGIDMRALCVALMNYGAEAQKYFAATTDYTYTELMNVGFEQYQDLVKPYSSNLVEKVGTVGASKAGIFGTTVNGFDKRAVSVSANGIFALNYYFTPSFAAEKVTLYYWDATQFASVATLTAENASGSKEMTLLNGQNEYWACIDGIAAKEIDQTIYACAVYEVDGVTYSTGVIPYSVATYCVNKASGESKIKAFAEAMVVYCYHAKTYFNY